MALDIFSIDGAGEQVENYIYMYHLREFIVLPSFVDSVQENFNIRWQSTPPLGRSAPIYSFQSSGPRSLQLKFDLHRDMMYQLNKNVSDAKVSVGNDYVDTLIKDLQACVLPDYDGSSKAVNPPIVALRIGSEIFIKGVITSNLGLTRSYPLLSNGKYSNISISFTIEEIDPYDARTVRNVGSYRNVSTTLDYSNSLDVMSFLEETDVYNQTQVDVPISPIRPTSPQTVNQPAPRSVKTNIPSSGTTSSSTTPTGIVNSPGGGGFSSGGGGGRR